MRRFVFVPDPHRSPRTCDAPPEDRYPKRSPGLSICVPSGCVRRHTEMPLSGRGIPSHPVRNSRDASGDFVGLFSGPIRNHIGSSVRCLATTNAWYPGSTRTDHTAKQSLAECVPNEDVGNERKKRPLRPRRKGRLLTYPCLLSNSAITFRAATGITVPGPKMADAPCSYK